MLDRVSHRQREIRLSIKLAGDERDGASWDQLAHEHDPAPPFVCAFPPDVKAQIHFLEVAVERDRQPDDARVEKKKANNADECLAFVKVEFGFDGNERLKD